MMVLSTKGRYAARIMVYLAAKATTQPATKFEIGKAEEISADYVEQIMIRLKAAGLVRSHRGRNGGFSLRGEPLKITLADVLNAVEDPVCPAPCMLNDNCTRIATCPTRSIWLEATRALEKIFSKTTLAQIVKNAKLLEMT